MSLLFDESLAVKPEIQIQPCLVAPNEVFILANFPLIFQIRLQRFSGFGKLSVFNNQPGRPGPPFIPANDPVWPGPE